MLLLFINYIIFLIVNCLGENNIFSLSVNQHQHSQFLYNRIITQTLSSKSNSLGYFVAKSISMMLTISGYKPFKSVTVDELVFGYDDTLVNLAHTFYPREQRPMSKMGLLIGVRSPDLFFHSSNPY